MATNGNHPPNARVRSAGRPPWEIPPSPAAPTIPPAPAGPVAGPMAPAPAGDGGPARPAWRVWWVLPFCGALVVIAIAAGVIAIRYASQTPYPGPSRPPAAAAPMPAEMFPGALFSALTQDIEVRNETAFLRLASPGARPAMKTWWDNLNAIGFTAGAVIPTAGGDTVRVDRHGDGSTIVLAGAHSPLDPSYQGKPGVPLERYRIGLHFASPTATGQITSWQPLGSGPWDGPSGLYVRTSTNVVVAGPPGDSAAVNETLPLAQEAAAYDIGLVRQVNPNDLLQEGFVVFVSGDAAVRDGWFAADPQPPGWPRAWDGNRTFDLAGPGTSPDDYASAPGGIADDTTGGARVVVTPYKQHGQTPQQEIMGLERDFMIDILAAHDQELVNSPAAPPAPPAWTIEGLGLATEALYAGNTNPAPASYRFGPLSGLLRKLPSGFKTGKLPDAQELAGLHAQQWNDVAASVYEYIEQKYGINQMFASAILMWTQFSTPFGNVEDVPKSSASTLRFFKTATVEDGWRAWLKRAADTTARSAEKKT